MQKEERKAQLLGIAVKLAEKHGVSNVTRRHIAEKAKCSEPLVSHHLGNLDTMRKLIRAQAKKDGVQLPPKDAEVGLGEKLRKTKGYGGARANAGRPPRH